jgi:hypothetical protein
VTLQLPKFNRDLSPERRPAERSKARSILVGQPCSGFSPVQRPARVTVSGEVVAGRSGRLRLDKWPGG